ncbi:MAG: DUF2232 domain-containing protein [Holosporaceae bacterium]|jgi:uncharacterized protein YybS (DUF2232 family)|nr:DUF2232 domain-containing protein [Holosporaceae bacterium]
MSQIDRRFNLEHRQIILALAFALGGAFPCVVNFDILLLLFPLLPNVLIFLSFLCHGKKSGIISSITLVAVVAAFGRNGMLSNVFYFSLLPSFVVGYSLMRNVEANGKIWWYPESHAFRNLFLVAIISVLLLSLTIYSEDFLMKQAEKLAKIIFPEQLIVAKQFSELYIKCFVGMSVLSSTLGTIFDFLIANSISRRQKMNIRPEIDLSNLSIPPQIAAFPLVLFVAASIPSSISYLCYGLAIAGLVAPLVAGFSIVHFYADYQNNKIILYAFYGLLFLLFPLMILLVTSLGFADSFYAIRPVDARKVKS